MSIESLENEVLDSSIVDALNSVFSTMLECECHHYDSFDFSGVSSISSYEREKEKEEDVCLFVGSVGMVGSFSGMIYLYLSSKFANEATSKLTGLDGDEIDDEMIFDVCGELTNMFAGSFKNTLADIGFASTLTIPTVVNGEDMVVSAKGAKRHLRHSFQANGTSIVTDLVLA